MTINSNYIDTTHPSFGLPQPCNQSFEYHHKAVKKFLDDIEAAIPDRYYEKYQTVKISLYFMGEEHGRNNSDSKNS